MAVWRYDGTFSGFLTVCATLVSSGEEPEAIVSGMEHQNNLFSPTVIVESDDLLADKMLAAIAARMSSDSCRLLWQAFLSETAGMELLLWRYLSFGRNAGAKTDRFLAHPAVAPVHRLAHAVDHEAHRVKGVIRFQESAGGYWYAAITPAYQVLELIAPHFADRCADMKWLIHDRHRNLAVAWNGTEWRVSDFDAVGTPCLSANEGQWSELWRVYFAGIAILERLNRRLQRQHLPERFRSFLTEMTRPSSR